KIPNKFTRSHGVGLPNPMFIKPPDGTKWKVFCKNINGEIWFEKGRKIWLLLLSDTISFPLNV
ncbi:hypothetical protein RYX36_016282, partial [Vicia faba]